MLLNFSDCMNNLHVVMVFNSAFSYSNLVPDRSRYVIYFGLQGTAGRLFYLPFYYC